MDKFVAMQQRRRLVKRILQPVPAHAKFGRTAARLPSSGMGICAVGSCDLRFSDVFFWMQRLLGARVTNVPAVADNAVGAPGSTRFRRLRRCGRTRRGRLRRADRGLFGRVCLFNQLIGDVIFVDVTHISHGFLADPRCSHPLDIVEPQVGVELFRLRFAPQRLDFDWPRVVRGESKQVAFCSSNGMSLK